ncbi:MAG: alpha-ketoacid dehydrogenase subunit beta [Bacilli bacterium]|nr:alpha-ketoacid dehydrogenase subunit beta [Bacilli bacterium]
MKHTITFAQAINEAFKEEMRKNKNIFHFGEDIRFNNIDTTKGLAEEFGVDRVMHAPISEGSFINAAIGASMMGLRPIIEIFYSDFLLLACDSIISEAATWRYVHGPEFKLPMVIRAANTGAGTGSGAYHAKYVESTFLHYPGIKVIYPSTPYDAKGLMKTAINDNNPIIFFEEKLLYGTYEEVPNSEYTIPFGKGIIRQEGKDVTIVAWGNAQLKCKEAATRLSKEGISAELIDPRTLMPFDIDLVSQSVKKTGRLIIVEDGNKRGGFGAEISAMITEDCFQYLKAPILRVAGEDIPIPSGLYGEKFTLPSIDNIVKNVIWLLKRFGN